MRAKLGIKLYHFSDMIFSFLRKKALFRDDV